MNYSRHWFSAKGRHGTHSPFVYAFVEQVLRNKNKIKTQQVKQLPLLPQTLSLREQKLLYKTLYFLKPAYVLLPEEAAYEWLDGVVQHMLPHIRVNPEPGFDYSTAGQGGLLIVPAMAQYHSRILQAIGAGIRVLVLHPHKDAGHPALWETLYTDAALKMSLDYWYFGLLLNDKAFKQKQHFRLR